MEYDMLGRKTTMADPDMGAWTYAYDAVGNLVAQDDAKGQRLCLYYDDLDRLAGKVYTGAGTACPAEPAYDEAYGYDEGANGVGRRTSMAGAWGGAAWTYDRRGRLVEETRTVAGVEGEFRTGYSYDAADRVETTTYPDGEEVAVTYNPQNLPETLSGAVTYVSAAEYSALGQVELLDTGPPGGGLTSYTYYSAEEGNNRLRRIESVGNETLLDLKLHLRPGGQRGRHRRRGGPGGGAGLRLRRAGPAGRGERGLRPGLRLRSDREHHRVQRPGLSLRGQRARPHPTPRGHPGG